MNIRIRIVENLNDARKEIVKIGSDPVGVKIMSPKAVHRIIKIEKIDSRAANIMKQSMLSAGGDVAVSRNALLGKQKTDVLIMGTIKQYESFTSKLKMQPFGLRKVADEIENTLTVFERKKYQKLKIGKYSLGIGKRTYIMGILNVTPDSFSGDGITNIENAVEKAKKMVEEGADIIDVGGESTRSFSKTVSEKEEWRRVGPVLKKLIDEVDVPVSIDSYNPNIVKKALDTGAGIINDISGLRNKEIVKIATKYDAPVIIMHMKGTPRNMQKKPEYRDVVGEIFSFFEKRIEYAEKNGVDKIIIDPGIGFGKNLEHNLEIIRRLKEFKSLGKPLLVGPSRKSFIGQILGLPAGERLEGTLASAAICIANGADIIRVHDVKECVRVARVMDAFVRK
ncbi:MAG: dihydropteroate synthase [Candidatus Thermoplasmatota archaeon]|nr:dihydropteroate synthase [Candidatus Thermoplasmatota archaeon]